MRTFSIATGAAVLIAALTACGGTSNSPSGGGGGGSSGGSGSLTVIKSTVPSLNGTKTVTAAAKVSSRAPYESWRLELDGSTSKSNITFIIDTSKNQVVDGDTIVTLSDGAQTITGYCNGANLSCPSVTINTSTRTLHFDNQSFASSGSPQQTFVVGGSATY